MQKAIAQRLVMYKEKADLLGMRQDKTRRK